MIATGRRPQYLTSPPPSSFFPPSFRLLSSFELNFSIMSLKSRIQRFEQSYPCWLLWVSVCVITLGFPNKYLERLAYFEDLIPGSKDPNNPIRPWTTSKTFSDRGDGSGNGQKTMRQKQQVSLYGLTGWYCVEPDCYKNLLGRMGQIKHCGRCNFVSIYAPS